MKTYTRPMLVQSHLFERRDLLPRATRQGFTLLELLVSLVIAGVLFTAVGLSMSGFGKHLSYEAERLAQLFQLAREEAHLRGGYIRFHIDEEGYAFLVRRDKKWLPPEERALASLQPRRWEATTDWQLQRPYGPTVLEFGRDWVTAPFVLRLSRADDTVRIQADGLGKFSVQ